MAIIVEPLRCHTSLWPRVAQWFEEEWPEWYGAGGRGNAVHDVQAFASGLALPRAVVAFVDGEPAGTAALKASSISGFEHLGPWVAAAYVRPGQRGQGIGSEIVRTLQAEARGLGYDALYCGTSSARSLLLRLGWTHREETVHDGHGLGVYSIRL